MKREERPIGKSFKSREQNTKRKTEDRQGSGQVPRRRGRGGEARMKRERALIKRGA